MLKESLKGLPLSKVSKLWSREKYSTVICNYYKWLKGRFIVQFQKISIPGGSQKPKFLKECMKVNWKFLGGGGVQTKKTFRGGGIDIFWNHTFPLQCTWWVNNSSSFIYWSPWYIYCSSWEPIWWRSVVWEAGVTETIHVLSYCLYTPRSIDGSLRAGSLLGLARWAWSKSQIPKESLHNRRLYI